MKKYDVYNVPSIKAINKLPKRWVAASLFAGCGGASTGMKLAGYDVRYANEFVPIAAKTYKLNSPKTFVDKTDVRKVDAKKIMRICKVARGELDYLDFSPPCFIAGSLVRTHKGLIPIETLNVHNYVLTHKSRYRKITAVMQKEYKGNIVVVEPLNRSKIYCTLEHPFYVSKLNDKGLLSKPEWVEARSLNKDHFIYVVRDDCWEEVKSVDCEYRECIVYNISVEEDETYTVNDVAVHNCKMFSRASLHSRTGKKADEVVLYSENIRQRVDDLFGEAMRLLKAIKPKVFCAENVPGMLVGNNRGFFLEFLEQMKACGYIVEAAVINAGELGTPQARKRLVFIGVRKDIAKKYKLAPVFPKPLGYTISIREILPHIKRIKLGGARGYESSAVPSPTITATDATNSETGDMSCGGWVELASGKKRKYTIDELKKVFAFPADFKLIGTFEQRWERLGRSHAPLAVYYIAATIAEQILIPLAKAERK